MIIYGLQVTSNYFAAIGDNGCHIELAYDIRFVFLADTGYATLAELQTAIEALTFPSK
jgi:hypothetical protein